MCVHTFNLVPALGAEGVGPCELVSIVEAWEQKEKEGKRKRPSVLWQFFSLLFLFLILEKRKSYNFNTLSRFLFCVSFCSLDNTHARQMPYSWAKPPCLSFNFYEIRYFY